MAGSRVDLNMPERNQVLFSERCRALAKECRVKALLFHNQKARDDMFRLANDYESKALLAEELEATLRTPVEESPSLIPDIAEAFVNRIRAGANQSDQRVANPGGDNSVRPVKNRVRRKRTSRQPRLTNAL